MILTVQGQPIHMHVAQPAGRPKGCLVVLHEAFGLTPHILRVCNDYAQQGYVCIAPALFAWATGTPEGTVLPQNAEGLEAGRNLIMATTPAQITATIAAVAEWASGQGLRSATLGYCWGGSCAYGGAATVPSMVGCVAYYGGKLAELAAHAQPTCPTLIHLAEHDRYIPLAETQAAFAAHHPAAQVWAYAADHGFNRDDGKTFDPAAAAVAKQRTQQLLAQAFGAA